MEKTCPIPVPFSGRVVGNVVFLTLLFFLPFLGRFIFSPLMPTISEDIAITSGQVGSVFLVGSIRGAHRLLGIGVRLGAHRPSRDLVRGDLRCGRRAGGLLAG